MSYLEQLIIVIAFLTPVAYTKCYIPNGTDTNLAWSQSDRYGPCDPKSGGASMCCSQKYGGDVCVPIGRLATSLCYNQGANNLWRESCTDSSWTSNNCVKLFMNVSNKDIPLTNCSSVNLGQGFCYGDRNFGCCRAGMAVFIDPDTGNQVATNPLLNNNTSSTGSSSTSPTTPTSTSSSSNPTNTAADTPRSGLSDGTIHAIIASVTVVVGLLLIGIAFWMYRKKSKKGEALNLFSQNRKSPSYMPVEMPITYPRSQWQGKSELEGKPSGTESSTASTTAQSQEVVRKPVPRASSNAVGSAELAA